MLLRLGARALARRAVPRRAPLRRLCAAPAETINVTFVEDGEEVTVEAEVGKTILEVAHANEIDLEGAHKIIAAPLLPLTVI